jgi:hypothetical protein
LVYRETSHTKGVRITGKAMVVSTVNAKKGGAEYEKIWKDSDLSKRDKTDKPFRDFTQYLYPLNTVWKVI